MHASSQTAARLARRAILLDGVSGGAGARRPGTVTGLLEGHEARWMCPGQADLGEPEGGRRERCDGERVEEYVAGDAVHGAGLRRGHGRGPGDVLEQTDFPEVSRCVDGAERALRRSLSRRGHLTLPLASTKKSSAVSPSWMIIVPAATRSSTHAAA